MMRILGSLFLAILAHPAFAERANISGLPPYTEAILPVGTDLYAVAIGPGGPGEEFGSDEANGNRPA